MQRTQTLSGARWKHRPNPLPTLPPEIWRLIIGWATTVPGALDTDCRDPFDTPPHLSSNDEQKALRAALVTKRYVVRVCKAWQEIATPYLYEYILIGRGRVLQSLRTTLLLAAEQNSAPDSQLRALGSWTRRLDLHIRDPESLDDYDVWYLVEIIRCLPNLATFIVSRLRLLSHPIPMPPSVLQGLAETCGRSLRVFDIRYNLNVHLGDEDWDYLLASMPNLSLVPLNQFYTSPKSFPPHVHSLVLSGKDMDIFSRFVSNTDTCYTDLRELRIFYYGRAISLLSMLHTISRPFGRTVERLIIEQGDPIYASTGHVELRMHGLSENYSKLKQVILHAGNLSTISIRSLPPSVNHLGIRYKKLCPPSSIFACTFDSLKTLDAASLHTVRFLDRQTVDCLRNHNDKVLVNGRSIVRWRGWRLEDHEGHEL